MSKFHKHEWDLLPINAFKPRGHNAGMKLFGKSDAPEPDPNIGIAAKKQADLADRQYDFYQNTWAPLLKTQTENGIRIADEQGRRSQEMQDYQLGRSKQMDARYDTYQVPLENQVTQMARDYNVEGNQQMMADQAGEDVASAFDSAQGRIGRGLAARGIRMGSGAATAAFAGNDLQRAVSQAAAMNKTRQAAKDIGWARMGEAAALGRGLVGFGTTSAGLSMNAGQQAISSAQSGVGLIGTASGIGNSAATTAGGLYAGSASALNQQYGTQMQGYSIESNNDPTKALIGAAAGAGMAYMGKPPIPAPAPAPGPGSDIRIKFDVKRVGTMDNGLPIYTFKYKHDPEGPTVMGVMAHEVAQVVPEAFIEGGFDGVHHAVDYSKL